MQTKVVRGTATSIRTEHGKTIVRYHNTDVVTFDAQTVTLDNGGYISATTCVRMRQAANQFGLSFNVSRKQGRMYAHTNGGTFDFTDNRFAFMRTTGQPISN